jgi:hypothetical protein
MPCKLLISLSKLTTLTRGLVENLTAAQLVDKFTAFYRSPLVCSKEHATELYHPDSCESSQHHHTFFLQDPCLAYLPVFKQEVLGRTNCLLSIHYILYIQYDTERIEKTMSNSFSIFASVFVTTGQENRINGQGDPLH